MEKKSSHSAVIYTPGCWTGNNFFLRVASGWVVCVVRKWACDLSLVLVVHPGWVHLHPKHTGILLDSSNVQPNTV